MMNLKRSAAIVIALGALAAWISAAMTPGGRPRARYSAARPPVDVRGTALAKEIARLHERLRPDATPRQPARDPFRFHTPAARPSPPRLAPVEAPVTVPPSQPLLKLVGVAEDAGAGGVDRTAIISGPGQLFLVKEGEDVTPSYRVGRISADVVELVDTRDGSTRRLALRP